MSKKIPGTILALLLVATAFVASPFHAAWSIREAIQSGNAEYLAVKIEWPRVRETLRQSLMQLPMLPVLLPRIVSATRAVLVIERHHPAKPHFYLSVVGTDPEQQGGGIGSALLTPVLERCDLDQTAAYLESSKESNLSFYARHGFAVTKRIELPEGPPLWLMWREPPGRRRGHPGGCRSGP